MRTRTKKPVRVDQPPPPVDELLDSIPALNVHLQAYVSTFRSKPKVLIIGNYGNGNLGDEAILAGILDDLDGTATPTVISRSPQDLTSLHGVNSVQTLSWSALRAAARADVIAIGGGGIFGNGMPLLPRLLPLIALLLQAVGKPVVFLALGAYATAPPYVLAALRMVTARSELITVRDPESAAVMGPRSRLVKDPAIGLKPASDSAALLILRQNGIDPRLPLLGISLKPAMTDELTARQNDLADAAVQWWLENTMGQVVFLTMSSHGDFGLGQRVSDRSLAGEAADRANESERIGFVGPHVHPGLMKAVIARMSVVVAHRLHAQIFAHASDVDLVGLTYERKSDEFLRLAGAATISLHSPTGHDEDLMTARLKHAYEAHADRTVWSPAESG